MTIWTALKQLNRRFDRWSAHAADHLVATLDDAGDRQKPCATKHIGVWDLLRRDPAPGESEASTEK